MNFAITDAAGVSHDFDGLDEALGWLADQHPSGDPDWHCAIAQSPVHIPIKYLARMSADDKRVANTLDRGFHVLMFKSGNVQLFDDGEDGRLIEAIAASDGMTVRCTKAEEETAAPWYVPTLG